MVAEATSIPHQDVTYKIIGCAMTVHNKMGPEHKESAYHQAMSLAMEEAGLSYEEETQVEIAYQDVSIELLYLDHLVEECILVEEKALSHLLTFEETAQVITYLAATGYEVGLLINFGRRSLQYKRILRPSKLENWRDRVERYLWKAPA